MEIAEKVENLDSFKLSGGSFERLNDGYHLIPVNSLLYVSGIALLFVAEDSTGPTVKFTVQEKYVSQDVVDSGEVMTVLLEAVVEDEVSRETTKATNESSAFIKRKLIEQERKRVFDIEE